MHCSADLSQQNGIVVYNRASAIHAYGVPGRKNGGRHHAPLPPTRRGDHYLLFMVDYFTKVAEAELMKSQDAKTIASTFFNFWICQHGVSDQIHSDQGPNSESRLFIELGKDARGT
ncbi:unnamed protein product [Taenia asiatica]|uniref:Integrase catalytic domain-containing protein n=1 Tax=Taenia asiatica TaxID=60517 RepID=A0A0R3W2S6_TAEAS|nr:unnamed protein product [Taenia asiatica]